MAKHDENKDLKSFSRVGRIDYGYHQLKASRSTIIGIHTWGRIDYLTHYCGWTFIWDSSATPGIVHNETINDTKSHKRQEKDSKTRNYSKQKKF